MVRSTCPSVAALIIALSLYTCDCHRIRIGNEKLHDVMRKAVKKANERGDGRKGSSASVYVVDVDGQKYAVKKGSVDTGGGNTWKILHHEIDVGLSLSDKFPEGVPGIAMIKAAMVPKHLFDAADSELDHLKGKRLFANDPGDDRHTYFLMDLAKGIDAADFLQQHADDGHTLKDVLPNVLKDVVGSLCKVREQFPQFAHLDLHLWNIKIHEEAGAHHATVLDLGMSTLHASDADAALIRDVHRMEGKSSEDWFLEPEKAPERFTNPPRSGKDLPAADVWRVGILIYKFLTGKICGTGAFGAPLHWDTMDLAAFIHHISAFSDSETYLELEARSLAAEDRIVAKYQAKTGAPEQRLREFLQTNLLKAIRAIPNHYYKILQMTLQRDPKKRASMEDVKALLEAHDARRFSP